MLMILNWHHQVQLDTGSSDLWLDTSDYSLTNLTDTQVVGSIVYV